MQRIGVDNAHATTRIINARWPPSSFRRVQSPVTDVDDAGPRDRPPRVVRRQRCSGRLLLHARVRVHRDRLPGARDRLARPRLARARAGPDPARADGHADRRRRDRRPPAPPRRRRPQGRAERPRRGGRLLARGRARRPRRRRARARPRTRTGASCSRRWRPTATPSTCSSQRSDYTGPVPARLRGARRDPRGPTACWRASTTSSATSSSGTCRSGSATTSASSG